MKKLLFLATLIAAGILGYNYFVHVTPASAEERALAELEHQFDSANSAMMQAGRTAGVSGIDTTADIEAARSSVRRVENKLKQLTGRLESASARARAERLERRIQEFRRKVD
ncbi:MAG: hypothetical protein ACE5HU_09285 [Acidobacteriota bacterium]